MRKMLRKIIHVLDGSPAEYGPTEHGQSLVELALMVPILLIMLMGLIELGWFTNSYMILLEASRVGARFGTVLTDNNDPIAWEANVVKVSTVDASGVEIRQVLDTRNGVIAPRLGGGGDSNIMRDCENAEGFFESVACVTVDAMLPLAVDTTDDEFKDDIVVSVFSINLIPSATDPNLTAQGQTNLAAISKPFKDGGQDPTFTSSAPGGNPDSAQVMVTGRYPSNANECNNDHRDPFDINSSGTLNTFELDSNRRYIMDPDNDGTIENAFFDAATNEQQRGFALTGKWEAEDGSSGCFGSEWSIRRMEAAFNLRNIQRDADQMQSVPPSQAVVLVEIFDRHDLLLDFPAFSPLYTILGGEDGAYIKVWAAFPVPSAEFSLNLNQ